MRGSLSEVARGRASGGRTFRLVATDLDGTLLRSDATVSARTRDSLRRLGDHGVHHVVVTGRPAAGCGPFFEALGYRGLAVCGQGAQVYDVGRGLLLSSARLDPEIARPFLAGLGLRVGPLDLAVVSSGLGGEFVITEGFLRGDDRELAPFRLASAADLWNGPVDKVLIRHRRLCDEELAAAAARLVPRALTVVHAGPDIVEVLPAGFDKATGLADVAGTLGVPSGEVIAFGDMPNDIPMLAWAGHGVAMGNGHADLMAVADEIAPVNDEDGVAAVIDRILEEGARG